MDDIITPDCLAEIAAVPDEYCMCYSNTVNVNWPQNWKQRSFLRWYGWKYRPFEFKRQIELEAVSAEPYPQSISKIRFAPNHVRAYRTKDYREIGGHDESMTISDDHDINLRMYLHWKVYHIDKPLYIYRVHWENTRLKYTQEIQTTMREQHDKYIVPLMKKWSETNWLKVIDLGWAFNAPEGFITVDRHNADVNCDLNGKRPFEDNSVGLIRASNIIEHLKDPIHTMNEAYRVLAHWGVMMIEVPDANGLWWVSDPTHVSRWNIRSFRYYTEPGMRKYIEPECNCKFNLLKPAEEKTILDWCKFVFASLMAEKEWHRFYWTNHWVKYE